MCPCMFLICPYFAPHPLACSYFVSSPSPVSPYCTPPCVPLVIFHVCPQFVIFHVCLYSVLFESLYLMFPTLFVPICHPCVSLLLPQVSPLLLPQVSPVLVPRCSIFLNLALASIQSPLATSCAFSSHREWGGRAKKIFIILYIYISTIYIYYIK